MYCLVFCAFGYLCIMCIFTLYEQCLSFEHRLLVKSFNYKKSYTCSQQSIQIQFQVELQQMDGAPRDELKVCLWFFPYRLCRCGVRERTHRRRGRQ